MINLLLVGSLPPPFHGSSIYLNNIFKLLKEDGEIDVFMVNTSDGREDIDNMGKWSISNVTSGIKGLNKLVYMLIKVHPDIVYVPISQNKPAYFRDGILIILSKLLNSIVLIHLHGSYFRKFYDESGLIYKKFIDITLSNVGGAIVLGEKLKSVFEKWMKPEKIFVLPNYIKWAVPINSIERKGINGKIRLTYLGNIIESKGIFDFLEAIKRLSIKHYNISLDIIGKIGEDAFTKLSANETESKLKYYLKYLGNSVEYHGSIYNEVHKKDILSNTDIFIFPSWLEGQPLVILEAMSCGCAIISTKDVGAIDETVIDGETGLLVEKRNVQELSKAISKLILDENLRERMRRASFKRFNENYSEEIHLGKLKSIIIGLYNVKNNKKHKV